MAAMPPVQLGAILLGAYGAAFAARGPLVKRYVLQAAEADQPKRQFYLDLCVSLLAGVLASIYNMAFLAFPITSTLSLLVGCLMAGFFAALDAALARERQIITDVVAQNRRQHPPKRLYSMTRKFFMAALTSVLFFSLVLILVFTRDVVWLTNLDTSTTSLASAQMTVVYEIFFIMVVMLILIVNLIVSYSKNLKLLFANETSVLERVSQGDLTGTVPIATNDEFGLIAGHTNSMIDGLRHRMQLIKEIKLAEEIQQNLLPKDPPKYPGIDVSGISLYCDEIGGDYYDFLDLPDQKLGIVVADASGHGIGAAMHMTAARAFVHLSAREYYGPAQLLTEVNRYITRDSDATSRFLVMFLLEINKQAKTLKWVRAGHDPAILYNPMGDAFEELSGDGMALGVMDDYAYQSYERKDWTPGSIIVVGTDGIHETRNNRDEMFGQDRLRQIIRDNHTAAANEIQNKVLAEVQSFRGKLSQEDDVTIVVVKLL